MGEEKNNQNVISQIYLYDYIKKNINLGDFLESEIGARLKWKSDHLSACLPCPMPHHRERKPSFHIKYLENDKVWIFNCFGCGAKGTIIDFCMDYYELTCSEQAIDMLRKRFDFKDIQSIVIDSLNNLEKKIGVQKKIECQNIVISNGCRVLLKKDYNKYKVFVLSTYKKLNKALDEEDIDTIQEIDNSVFEKAQEI